MDIDNAGVGLMAHPGRHEFLDGLGLCTDANSVLRESHVDTGPHRRVACADYNLRSIVRQAADLPFPTLRARWIRNVLEDSYAPHLLSVIDSGRHPPFG
jgi:hypothetical protein